MAVTTWRSPRSLTIGPAALGVASVVGALLLGHWWAYSAVPSLTYSLWGPYFITPLGWLAVAAFAFLWFDTLSPADAEHTVDRRTVLTVALLIGLFLVALQVLGGILAHLGRSPFAHSPRWLTTNLLFAGAPLLAIESARCVLLRTLVRVNATLALVSTTVFLAVIQLSYSSIVRGHSVAGIDFWAATFIPLVAMGLVAGFFVLYGGVRAALLVTGPLALFTYFSPFLLVADWPIRSLIGVAGPAMALWISESMFSAEGALEDEDDTGGWLHAPSVSWVVTAVVGLTIFWFSFGFFGFRPVFIPSGSMEPNIHPGDLALIGPVSPDEIKVGDIVMYQANPQRVLHRVIEIRTTDKRQREFILKGDNNNVADMMPVTEKQIVGRYVAKVPKLGWVPLKFNQLIGMAR